MSLITYFTLLILLEMHFGTLIANHDHVNDKRIKLFRCFCEDMSIGDEWWTFGTTVGHVGIQVQTVDGNSYTIHNLGPSGQKTTVSSRIDGMNYYSKWIDAPSSENYTIGQIRKISDGVTNGYSFWSNNCYHHRNRILQQFNYNIQKCPNPYTEMTPAMLYCSPVADCEDENCESK